MKERIQNLLDNHSSIDSQTGYPDLDVAELVDRVLDILPAMPMIEATTNGGFLLKWHSYGIDLELSFQPHGQIEAYCQKEEQTWASEQS